MSVIDDKRLTEFEHRPNSEAVIGSQRTGLDTGASTKRNKRLSRTHCMSDDVTRVLPL